MASFHFTQASVQVFLSQNTIFLPSVLCPASLSSRAQIPTLDCIILYVLVSCASLSRAGAVSHVHCQCREHAWYMGRAEQKKQDVYKVG